MECLVSEVGVSQCGCPVCVAEWEAFLRWTSRPATSPAPVTCLTDPECECTLCSARRERTDGQTLESLIGEDYSVLREISNSSGYSGRLVGFELVNGNVWCFDYTVGEAGDTPVLVVPATPTGLELIVAHFDCYL